MSAMKKVALFLMIVGLAVAIVACQGPVGPKGDQGDQGDPGTDATPTTDGTPAVPFQALSNVTPTLLNADELVDDDGNEVEADEETKTLMVALSNYFIGVTPGVEYEFVDMNTEPNNDGVQNDLQADDPGNVIDGEINNETGMLEYTLTQPNAGWGATHYMTGFVGDIKATNSNGVAAIATVTIMLNQVPTFVDGGTR